MLTSPLSTVMIGILVLIFAGELMFQVQTLGSWQSIAPQILVALGANYPPAFFAGEYWRVLSSCFLHVSLIHVLMNSYALYLFGPMVERSFGRFKLLQTFLFSGIVGSLTTNLMHRDNALYVSAGASGAICGLFGVIFITGKLQGKRLPKEFHTWLNQNMLLMVGISFAPQIDKWGHFGGLASGILLGWIYFANRPQTSLWEAEEITEQSEASS